MPTNISAGSRGEMPDPTWRQRPAGAPFFAYYNLDAPPVWDSLAVADGRLYLATTDGQVRCYSGETK